MKLKELFAVERVKVIAIFGEARLIQTQDFKYQLRGGSAADRAEAKEWIALFAHDVVVERT